MEYQWKTPFLFKTKKLKDNEIKVEAKEHLEGSIYSNEELYIPVSAIPWIINTLRNKKPQEYDGIKFQGEGFKERTIVDSRALAIWTNVIENSTSYLKIYMDLPTHLIKGSIDSASIAIPYRTTPHGQEMEYIEPLLKDLEKYLTPKERDKLTPPWSAQKK